MKLLEDVGYLGARAVKTLMEVGSQLSIDEGDLLEDPDVNRRMIDRLLYLTITRPDLFFAVNKLSQFVSNPRISHLQAAHRVFQYIKSSPGQGLFFFKDSDLQLKVSADADWASCKDTRKLVTWFCVFLGDSLVSWKRSSIPFLDHLLSLNIEQWLWQLVK